MGMDVTVTLHCSFPGCTAISQPQFPRASQHLHSSIQINILVPLRAQIPLSSLPSFLLSVSFYSLPLTLSCWLLVRWCCHCMGGYGKWVAGDFSTEVCWDQRGDALPLETFTLPCSRDGPASPSSSFPLPFNSVLMCAHSYLLEVFCLDLYSGQFSCLRSATSPELPIVLLVLCDSVLFFLECFT